MENKNINYDRIERYAKDVFEKLKSLDRVGPEAKFQSDAVAERNEGKIFSTDEHVYAMLLSFLSCARPWKPVQEHIERNGGKFIGKDKDDNCVVFGVCTVEEKSAEELAQAVRNVKCGNMQINKQMPALKDNLDTFRRWERECGGVDSFYECKIGNLKDVSSEKIVKLVNELADSKSDNKLRRMGVTLVSEYLRNVGFDLPKPDRHILRILSKDRLGFSNSNEDSEEFLKKDIFIIFDKLEEVTGLSQVELDSLLWTYCAGNKENPPICTKDKLECGKCKIRGCRNHPKSGN